MMELAHALHRVPWWFQARGSAKDATAVVAKDTNATIVTDAWWIELLINPSKGTYFDLRNVYYI